jgi:hypothetical protein
VPVNWEESAASLLEQRDRFTQKAIKEEFEATFDAQIKPSLNQESSSTIAFDPANNGYLTPVADMRYSVIWYLKGDDAEVRAVVPTTRFEKRPGLLERVRKVVLSESNQLVNLK